jgi:hypothetical protein
MCLKFRFSSISACNFSSYSITLSLFSLSSSINSFLLSSSNSSSICALELGECSGIKLIGKLTVSIINSGLLSVCDILSYISLKLVKLSLSCVINIFKSSYFLSKSLTSAYFVRNSLVNNFNLAVNLSLIVVVA